MRLLHLTPGAGALHCGACLRDAVLVRALARRGHAVELQPLYTPIRLDRLPEPEGPVHLGGIASWLAGSSRCFARLPRPMLRLLASRHLLKLAGRAAGATDPAALGPLTVSVLEGAEGRQAAELGRLLSWLEGRPRPDVVVLSNALLAGLVPLLSAGLGTPVALTFQGEEPFLDGLPEPWRGRAWALLRSLCGRADRLLATSRQVGEGMCRRLGMAPERLLVVPPGLDAGAYPLRPPPGGPLTLGHLGALVPGKGLDLAIRAAAAVRPGGRPLRLIAAGRRIDLAWERSCRQLAAEVGLEYRHLGELDWRGKLDFWAACDAALFPSRIPEARGMAALEAMACGVPVLAPCSGIFPELRERIPGLLLHHPGEVAELAADLNNLLADRQGAVGRGRACAEDLRATCNDDAMAEAMERALAPRL